MPKLSFVEPFLMIAFLAIIAGVTLRRVSHRIFPGISAALAAILLSPLLGPTAIATAATADAPFPDRNRRVVVDAANVIPDEQEHALADRIGAYVKRTGHQLVVATVPSLGGQEIRDYGYRLGRAWGLGRRGVDDGVILLLAPTERKVDIEVGYGLEPKLTEALTSTIIHERITPKLKTGDIGGALSDGADSIMAAASGKPDDTIRAVPVSPATPVTYSALEILSYLLMLATPAGLLMWLLGRSERREQAASERRYVETRATAPARPQPTDRTGFVKATRARDTDDVATTLGAAVVADDLTRRAASNTPSYSPPPSPSFDSGTFDAGGGSFGGGGASSDY